MSIKGDRGDGILSPSSSLKRTISGDGEGDRKRFASSKSADDLLDLKTFCDEYPDIHRNLKLAYNLLLYGNEEGTSAAPKFHSDNYILLPVKIQYCDADDDVCFSKCFCRVSGFKNGVRFYHVFGKGCDMLVKYLNNAEIPEDPAMKAALRNLLLFLIEHEEELISMEAINEEEVLTVFLMNHLVIPLSLNKTWIMDKGYKNKAKLRCPCSLTNCPMRIPDFSDTSIGNVRVWHGSLDALAGDSIATAIEKPEEEDPGIESAVEVKFELRESGQLYGQTIVFSFLQHMYQKDLIFVPVLGLKRHGIKIMMYDSKQDMFLTSKTVSFISRHQHFRMVSYIMVWLACNYKMFSTSLTGDALAMIGEKKARFHELINEKVLAVYEKKLRYGHASKKFPVGEDPPIFNEDVAKVDGKVKAKV